MGAVRGRLPTKQTTKHTPVPKIPEGAVNLKGRIKTRDKNTGKTKYLDAKIGLALDQVGNLTHSRF